MKPIPLPQCPHCGMAGRHASPADCISALRRKVAASSCQLAAPDLRTPCGRCALGGPHTRAVDCIDALRDVLAVISIRATPITARQKEVRGGRYDRHDNRFVVFHGERLNLTEAGRRLGLTAAALHYRIVARLGTRDYREPDLSAIHADVKLNPSQAAQVAAASRGVRFVILDGERLPIATAGRRLGLRRDTLHYRIARLLGTAHYEEVDVRRVGADLKPVRKRSPGIGCRV
jgi:hypothetical protein